MCVVGVFLRGHRDHDGMEDKMLMAEALNNTGWTSADAERIGLLRIRSAMCGSAFTGAHRHHCHVRRIQVCTIPCCLILLCLVYRPFLPARLLH